MFDENIKAKLKDSNEVLDFMKKPFVIFPDTDKNFKYTIRKCVDDKKYYLLRKNKEENTYECLKINGNYGKIKNPYFYWLKKKEDKPDENKKNTNFHPKKIFVITLECNDKINVLYSNKFLYSFSYTLSLIAKFQLLIMNKYKNYSQSDFNKLKSLFDEEIELKNVEEINYKALDFLESIENAL